MRSRDRLTGALNWGGPIQADAQLARHASHATEDFEYDGHSGTEIAQAPCARSLGSTDARRAAVAGPHPAEAMTAHARGKRSRKNPSMTSADGAISMVEARLSAEAELLSNQAYARPRRDIMALAALWA